MTQIAVIGAGLIGKKHIATVQKFAELHAIIDPNPATAELARTANTLWFESVDAYLASHSPDGAIIATPNHLHEPQGLACLAQNIPTLIEKPIAHTVEAAQNLTKAATKTPLLVGHHRRHSPLIKAVKSAITQGRLGELITVSAQFWLYKPADYFTVDWRAKTGGGPTMINLIHDIDLLRHFCGKITRVQAVESHRQRKFEVEDTSAVILEFESGTLGTVSISDTVVAPWSWELTAGENPVYHQTDQSCYMLGGTRGSLSVPDLKLWQHPGARSWWEPIEAQSLSYTTADPVEEQFLHFLDVIENGATPLVTGADGLANQQVLEAIKNAAQTGAAQIL